MNYPPANVWTKVELDIEPEPQLFEVTTPSWNHRLFLPAEWPAERRQAWLEWWMRF